MIGSSMIGTISHAVTGLFSASKKAENAANNIANMTTPGYDVDPAREAVELKIAEIGYKANVAVIRTADDMSKELGRIFDERV